jgi:hypothetical protein
MKYIVKSAEVKTTTKPEKYINLFQQFFIHPDPERQKEIRTCLKYNVMNPFISYIILFHNYKETDGLPYTEEELGCWDKKIIQVPIDHRMTYADAIHYSNIIQCQGYNIIANADIFFDESLESLLNSDLNQEPKRMMAQLRYEYDGSPTGIKIFGPRADSQDAWIYHSKYNERLTENIRGFHIKLGMPGCDNKITYLFQILGFELVNDPQLIHCLHYHKTQIRNYSAKDAIPKPYVLIIPEGGPSNPFDVKFTDNDKMFEYISNKIHKEERFIIPRIAGVENIVAHNITIYNGKELRFDTMKNNAGVQISSNASCKKYADAYFKAFENCDMLTGWSKDGFDNVYGGIKDSQDYVDERYKKKRVWAESCLDIFNYIHYEPWTMALRGKRILIISSFIDSIKVKVGIREKIFGRDLFPDCDFTFIKPPQLSGDSISREWDIELADFCDQLDTIKDDYDIALVSCGGLGNLVCNHIYNSNKSAIYVGGVLSVWFGVYNNRMMEEKSDILKLYMNEHWSRPKISERPQGWEKVERGCYV